MGYVVEYPQAILGGASEEHGQIDLSNCDRKPEIGERVQIILAHPCPCFNEHDEIYALRNGWQKPFGPSMRAVRSDKFSREKFTCP